MLNRLKEITLFKEKFPLNIRGVSYIILLHCFFSTCMANSEESYLRDLNCLVLLSL